MTLPIKRIPSLLNLRYNFKASSILKLINRKTHWENIYSTKDLNEVSWYQPVPETSLDFIKKLNLNKDANIIDIGGGDSFLVDNLIQLGYSNITVLDISEKAIDRAKERLGKEASKVNWIVSDVNDFEPTETPTYLGEPKEL